MIVDINDIYAYYGLFILFRAGILLTRIYSDFILAIKATIIANDNLDYYKYTNNDSDFCKFYYSIIIEKKITKFRFANFINIWFY